MPAFGATGVPLGLGLPQYTAAAAAVALVAVVVLRWQALERRQIVVRLIAATLLAIFATGVTQGLPSVDEILSDLADVLGKWTYLLVGVFAFIETGAFIGLIAPGESIVILGGVVAGQGEVSLTLLIAIVWLAAFLGDTASFFIGRRLGREFLIRHGARVQITEERLVQVEHYMDRHGGKTIVVGRFIGLVRSLAPFIAGASKMEYRNFLPYDIIGAGAWATAFCLLGYVFSQNLEAVIEYTERGVLIFGWTVGTVVAVVYVVRRFRKPEEREKLGRWLDARERHPAWGRIVRPLRSTWRGIVVPLARFFSPQLRFAIERFTPGNLGLEFTTAMSVVAVSSFGLYFFADYALTGANADVLTQLNATAFDIANRIRTTWLNDLAKLVTQLGAFYVAGPVALVAGVVFATRRRYAEALLVPLSLIVSVVLVGALKAYTDVPRPSGALVPTEGSSFPSGHAAYAVVYVSIAVARERMRGFINHVLLVTGAIVLAVVIGLTRVYLRAHYLTDVIGGFSLGVLIASGLAAIALVRLYVVGYRRAKQAGAVTTVDPTVR
jgi:undecaprenyl-diphosphatase